MIRKVVFIKNSIAGLNDAVKQLGRIIQTIHTVNIRLVKAAFLQTVQNGCGTVFADDDGNIGTALHLGTKDAVVLRFLIPQFHHTGSDDDPSARELTKNFQRSFGAYRIRIKRIIDNGESTGMFH